MTTETLYRDEVSVSPDHIGIFRFHNANFSDPDWIAVSFGPATLNLTLDEARALRDALDRAVQADAKT